MAGKKLLVADDSLTIQKVIRLALSNEGYEIQAVSDGNDAIQQISLFRPDVVLIDVSLPGKTAFEVKRAINEHDDLDEVRFILMSSAFEKVDEEQAEEVRFHGRLTKPFDPAHLRQILTEVLGQVTAKRSEKTSLLQRPPVPTFEEGPITLAPPPTDDESTDPDFLAPVRPDTPPAFPPPPTSGPVESLWDKEEPTLVPPGHPLSPPQMMDEEEEQADEDIPPPPPTGAPPAPAGQDSDIRHLTESTIRMSGLDDFQWSVNESVARKDPSPPVTPPPSEPREIGERTFTDLTRKEPPVKPLPGMEDLAGVTFELDAPDSAPAEEPPPFRSEAIEPPIPESGDTAPYSPHSFDPPPSLGSMQLEEVVKRQVEEAVQKLAQQLLPDVAERIIKQEIHRMLNEGVGH